MRNELRAKIDKEHKTLILTGCFNGHRDTRTYLTPFIIELAASGHGWIITADQVGILPDGVMLWIEMVEIYLDETKLVYPQSALAILLRYNDEYTHSFSEFLVEKRVF